MAIKIYETQIRPTGETGAVKTQPGQRISMDTATQIGRAVKGAAKTGIQFWKELEVKKSENEYYEKRKKLEEGDDTFEGMISVKEKASRESNPDRAAKIYNEGLAKAKQILGANYEHRYTKQLFEKELKKKEIVDGIEVRKKSNANFLAKSQTLELQELERLKKEIVYGETAEARLLAQFELDYKLNQDKTKNLFGPKHELIKNNAYADVEFYKAKRAIDANPMQGLEAAKKNKLITVENFEKLKSYAKVSTVTTKQTNATNVKNFDQGLDNYIVPSSEALIEAEKIAVNTGDQKTLKNISDVKKKRELLIQLKNLNMEEINQRYAISKRLSNTKGADPDLIFELNYIEKYKNNLESGLRKDPIQTANDIGTFETNPLNIDSFLKNPYQNEEFVQNVRRRIANAKGISEHYRSPLQFLTQTEKLAIKDAVERTTDPRILISIASGIQKAFATDANDVFKEISKDNETLGYLGGIANVNGINNSVVKDAADGYVLRKTDTLKKSFSRTDKNFLSQIAKYREAFPLTGQQNTYDNIIEGAINIYHARRYRQGKDTSEFKTSEFLKALQDATGKQGDYGGMEKYEGKFLPIPNYVKNGSFSSVVDILRDPKILAKASGNDVPKYVDQVKGKLETINPFKNGDPTFIGIGYGKYILSMGDHPFDKNANPEFVASSKPNFRTGLNYFIVDLNNIKTEIQRVM